MQKVMRPGDKEKKSLFEDDEDHSTASDSSSDDSASEEVEKLTINKKFAREYQNIKQKQELRQAQLDEDEDSSEDEEEDENADLLTNSVNLQFLRTMKALKKKDNSIYNPDSRFFEGNSEENSEDDKEGTEKRRPQRFKDVVRNQILEQMDTDENEQTSDVQASRTSAVSKYAYDEQQKEIRDAILKESKMAGDDDSDEEEDWMVVKERSAPKDDPKASEIEEEFQELEKISGSKANSSFADPRGEIKDGEKFLMDYIKNKKWIDKDDLGGDQSDDESLDDVDRADDFEANYNFRFEQAAAETASSGAALSIQTYARGQTMNTVRREDTTRKDKRQLRKERKEAERKAKEEQLKRLKNAKRQEMNQKLSQVRAVLGSVDESAVDEAALMTLLEGDYDPEKFENVMKEAYGEDFYEKEDSEWKSDLDVRKALEGDGEGEDVVGQDDVEGGLYDNYEGDENYDEEQQNEEWGEEEEEYVGGDEEQETQIEKKLKSKMQEELYKLDYEDIVAGMPTRFKYRQVEANDYGLTTQEILLARDSTLKQFVSLKKLAPYNEDGEFQVGSRKRRRFRDMLKQDLEEEMPQEDESPKEEPEPEVAEEAEETGKKKRRRLKKGKKKDKTEGAEEKTIEVEKSSGENETKVKTTPSKSTNETKMPKNEPVDVTIPSGTKDTDVAPKVDKKKKRRKRKSGGSNVPAMQQSRLASYGL